MHCAAAPATRISSWIFCSDAIRERSIGQFGQIGVQNATTEYRVRMTLCGGTLQPSVKLLITLEGTYYHPRDRCRVPNADCESCIQTISAASLDSTHPHPHVHTSRIRTEPCEYGHSRVHRMVAWVHTCSKRNILSRTYACSRAPATRPQAKSRNS